MQIYGGNWTLVVFAIVIVSWVFYRFAAPKSWREWSRAGLVQAFFFVILNTVEYRRACKQMFRGMVG